MKVLPTLFCCVALVFVQGCGDGVCSLQDVASLDVTVVGGEDPPGVCDATVVVRTAGVSIVATCTADGGDCRCEYGNDEAGTFEIEATLDGNVETQTVDVEMDESGCHVVTQEVCFFGECTE